MRLPALLPSSRSRGTLPRSGPHGSRGGPLRPGRPKRPRYPLALQLRTAVSRRRRLVAAVLLSIAAAIAVLQLSPAERDTVPVVVAKAPLGAGTVLSTADLEVVDYPSALAPGPSAQAADGEVTGTDGGPSSVEHWVGRTLSTAVVEGQPMTGPSVVGPDLLAGQPPGTTAVTVRVADPGALTHLRPGQRVDLVHRGTTSAGDGSESQDGEEDEALDVVARNVTVLWVADPAEPESGLLSANSPGAQQDLLVIGADTDAAAKIAASEAQELVPVLVSAGNTAP